MTNHLIIEPIQRFSINANKLNVTSQSPARHSMPHIHDVCEIYVNISGNVSFMVEKNLYSIQPGDILITKPYEYHHCIYNDDSDHLHYWIMFSTSENPKLFDFLLKKRRGTSNHIRLPKNTADQVIALCEQLTTVNPENNITSIHCFFEILAYIEQGLQKYNVSNETNMPENVSNILNYINKNYTTVKTIQELTSVFDVSIATLERYFKKYLAMTPKRYLEDKKLSNACKLLRQGCSVTAACFESGFDDYSHFIAAFKKAFHTTPLKYKKNI